MMTVCQRPFIKANYQLKKVALIGPHLTQFQMKVSSLNDVIIFIQSFM